MTPAQRREVDQALRSYWTTRDDARLRQRSRGRNDVGERTGATAGDHLDQVAALLARVCIAAGAPKGQVYYRKSGGEVGSGAGKSGRLAPGGITLPGFYRPTKDWDLIVYHRREPIVVVELKSQNGPSYSSNANNRAEEAIGSAVDFARARDHGLIPGDPWLGYVFVIEDDARSQRRSDRNETAAYPRDGRFDRWSYLSRVGVLCVRLVGDGHYNAAWAIRTSRPDCPGTENPQNCPHLASQAGKPAGAALFSTHHHEFDWDEINSGTLGYASFTRAMTDRITERYPEHVEAEQPTLY